MVHAFRSHTTNSRSTSTCELRVTGTYNMDQKITVEWECLTVVDALIELFKRLPKRPYVETGIRSFVSGHFYKLDRNLPDTKISEYRVSPQSLSQILEAPEMHDVMQRDGGDNVRTWTPKAGAQRLTPGQITAST